MVYGRCTTCKHDVTIGSDHCTFCGAPLPVLRPPTTGQGATVASGSSPTHSPPPTAALTAEELSSLGVKLQFEPQGTNPRATRPQQDDSRSTTAIDMRTLLGGPTSQPGIPAPRVQVQPNAPTYTDDALSQTDVEGLEPVRAPRGGGLGQHTKGHRPSLGRILPLAIVLIIACGALGGAGWYVFTGPGTDGVVRDTLDRRVELPAGDAFLGLSEDNVNTVLNMCFRISTNPNYECRRSNYEQLGELPEREASVEALSFDVYEVSNIRYEHCVGAGVCSPREAEACRFYTHRGLQLNARPPERMFLRDYPAVCVTREQAERFCQWRGGRLPTADEWERGARSGDDRLAPWGTLWAPDIINWAETDMGGFPVVGHLDGYDLTGPVDHFDNGATAEGLFNMLGNVSEWVAQGDQETEGVRGGSYRHNLRNLRATFEWEADPGLAHSDVGFRCVYPNPAR